MKQKKLLLRCQDDYVVVLSFVLDDDHGLVRSGTASEIDHEIARASSAWEADHGPVVSWTEIADSDLPSREFRNAWETKDGKKIGHNMPKARGLYMERIRQARDLTLEALDKEWMKASGQGKKQEADAVEAHRQKLRDLPATVQPLIDAATTVEEMKAIPLEF